MSDNYNEHIPDTPVKETMQLLSICYQVGLHGGRPIPFIIMGDPGIGKTQICRQLGQLVGKLLKKDFPVEIIAAPQRMPEEVGGIPVPDLEHNEVRSLPMKVGKKLLKTGQGVFIADELSSASQDMGGALQTAIQDGFLGDLLLPWTVARGALMNPADIAVNGRMISLPEANRFVWLSYQPSLEDWTNFQKGGTGSVGHALVLPPDWEAQFKPRALSLVSVFLRKHPAMFHQMPKAHNSERPWPSPRSWENATRLFAAVLATKNDQFSDLAHAAIGGCVGAGAADAFFGWLKKQDMPDPEELLDLKKNVEDVQKLIPTTSHSSQFALETMADAACLDHKKIKERWYRAWEILGPHLEKAPDTAIYAASTLCQVLNGTSKLPPDIKVPKEAYICRDVLAKTGIVGGNTNG